MTRGLVPQNAHRFEKKCAKCASSKKAQIPVSQNKTTFLPKSDSFVVFYYINITRVKMRENCARGILKCARVSSNARSLVTLLEIFEKNSGKAA